jgi:hypothetical protein
VLREQIQRMPHREDHPHEQKRCYCPDMPSEFELIHGAQRLPEQNSDSCKTNAHCANSVQDSPYKKLRAAPTFVGQRTAHASRRS